MKIIKRNGTEVVFDIEKINKAISKANNAVEEKVRLTPDQPHCRERHRFLRGNGPQPFR